MGCGREAEPERHVPRLVALEEHDGGPGDGGPVVKSRAVAIAVQSLHEEGCFILDLETHMFTMFGATASARVKAAALQLASCLRCRTPRRGLRRQGGRLGCRQVMRCHGASRRVRCGSVGAKESVGVWYFLVVRKRCV